VNDWYRVLTSLLEPGLLAAAPLVERGDDRLRRDRRGELTAARGGHWFHAASAGEMRGLAPLVQSLADGMPVVMTAQTAAGLSTARALLAARPAHRLPFDLPRAMRRAFESSAAAVVVLAETELWPNLLDEAVRRGALVTIVNGRLSDRAWPRYRKSLGFWRNRVARLAAVAAQSDRDADRFRALGVPGDRVAVTGSMKHDTEVTAPVPALHPWGERPIVVMGSVRPGEEALLAEAAALLREREPGLVVVAAPRHRAADDAVASAFRAAGFTGSRRSRHEAAAEHSFLLLDTMGELPSFYAVAGAAVVGGTFMRYGGHNVAEPARSLAPVVFGPDTANCRLEAETLVAAGGGLRANSAEAVADGLANLLGPGRSAAVAGAQRALFSLSGATERTRAFLASRGVPGFDG
jgi:3-deoxy-D-manno-octulosonic-acid transferase